MPVRGGRIGYISEGCYTTDGPLGGGSRKRAWAVGGQSNGIGEVYVYLAIVILCLYDGLYLKDDAGKNIAIGYAAVGWLGGKQHARGDDIGD